MSELSVTGGCDVHTVRFPVAAPPTTGERLRQDHINAMGVSFDERHDASTVIWYAPGQLESEPAWRADVYEDDPRPGHRAPDGHIDPYGGTLYDRISNSFALLVLTEDRVVEHALVAEAAARSLPFTVIHLSGLGARAVYGTTNVLVRPDQHVAWRGAVLPDGGAGAVLDRVLGKVHGGAATTDLVAAGTAGA
ncbi:hypothetical protein [Streptomyces yanii]|uniref:Uncharacterized protein n=1 Tax=Streptomyces yanii TaxID=78510 RepID=A0ABV5R233_9ACTN